jgi:hypothetical protein
VIEVDFVVKGYPGSGRRIEAEGNLATVSRPDLIQGAFMGDAVLRFDDVDFTTKFGWVTMIDWCLRLSVSVSRLQTTRSYRLRFSESDDFVSFSREEGNVVVTCSYAQGAPTVQYDDLTNAVREFVDGRLDWLAREFPQAFRNPAMADVYSRLGRPFPPSVQA